MDDSEAQRIFRQTGELYAKYGKPLEAEHWGKYIAIRLDPARYRGQVMVDEYMDVLDQRARDEWGDARALFTQVGGSAGPPKLLHPYGTPGQQQESRRMQAAGDRLYQQHGKPLEAEHWGKYLAVHPDGRTVLADDYQSMAEQADAELGPGTHFFQIGPIATHSWTSFRRVPDGQSQAIRRAPSSLIRRIAHD